MSIDWSILHWVRDVLTCPFLDFLMPKLILLSNGGAVWLLAVGMLVGNVCLKNFIARPRPCWLDESVPLLIARPSDYSFPSGHTMAGAIGATILMAADRRFGWAAIPLAVLIAFSRLYLYVHFPSDVLGGAVLGVGIGLLMLYGERRIAGRCKHRPLQ